MSGLPDEKNQSLHTTEAIKAITTTLIVAQRLRELHIHTVQRVFLAYFENLHVPCVRWIFDSSCGKWDAIVYVWDAYCEDVCEDIADYLVTLECLSGLHRIHLICSYRDTFDHYGTRAHTTSAVPDAAISQLTRSELIGKTILLFET